MKIKWHYRNVMKKCHLFIFYAEKIYKCALRGYRFP